MLPTTRLAPGPGSRSGAAGGRPQGADSTGSLTQGTPGIKNAGPITFGPDGILFVGDPRGTPSSPSTPATDLSSPASGRAQGGRHRREDRRLAGHRRQGDPHQRPGRQSALGQRLPVGCRAAQGPDAAPVLVRVDRQGKVTEVSLKDVKFAKANDSPTANGKKRTEAITGLAYVKGKRLRRRAVQRGVRLQRCGPFPSRSRKPTRAPASRSYHGCARQVRDQVAGAHVRRLRHCRRDHLLAAYTCTPLVKFPVSPLKTGERSRARPSPSWATATGRWT